MSAANERQHTAFAVSFPARAEYIVLSRLAIAALARLVPIDAEAVADLKLAVTEASTNVVQHAYQDGDGAIHLTCEAYDGVVRLTVEDDGTAAPVDGLAEAAEQDDREGGMGLAIMRAVVDEVTIEPRADGAGTRLTLVARVSGP